MSKFNLSEYSLEKLEKLVEAVREPLTTLSDITDGIDYFFDDSFVIDPEVQKDVVDIDESQRVLAEFVKIAETIEYDNLDNIHEVLATFRKSFDGLKPKQIMWAIRAALTGRTRGADISMVISILGKDKVIARTKNAIK